MARLLRRPEEFIRYRGVSIFHAYKDQFRDIALDYWYSTSPSGAPGSEYEFDVRELPGYRPAQGLAIVLEHARVIVGAIQAGILRANKPLKRIIYDQDTAVPLDRHV